MHVLKVFTWMTAGFIAGLCSGAGHAQNAADTGSPSANPSFTFLVQQRAEHEREVSDLIHAKDQATRSMALELALKDSDSVIRDLAISSYLTGFKALTPEIVLKTGSVVGPEDAPQIAFGDIKWSDDGKSFQAQIDVQCSVYRGVSGQIGGSKVSLHFDGACLSSAILNKGNNSTQRVGSDLKAVPCNLILAPNSEGDALEGDLHCLGVATVLKVQLAFGG